MPQGQSRTLKTPTYLGLVFSQFLAAFNDQAVHIIAVFYAGDMLVRYAQIPGLAEKHVVFFVPACFVAPFFLFSPLAGVLADKFSKRNIVIFWKLAEVVMMAIALVGFLLPQFAAWGWGDERSLAIASASLVVFAVFLMGTHSAFFVPAKYGIMPEILHPAILSKGNGFLEGSSFLAQILGTSFGGLLYGPLKPTFSGGDLEAGNAWIIGVVLFLLAVVGAGASLVMQPVPAAASERKFTLNPFGPLANNLRVVWRTRPLVLAVTGIAFFTGMTLFLRQGLLYEGETSKDLQAARQQDAVLKNASREQAPPGSAEAEAFVPNASEAQQAEMRVALLVAFIGLGVGIGSWLAGYLSGPKIELGLVPIGAAFIALATAGLAAVTQDGGSTSSTVACLVMIGVAAGLYIVPLYTLLQHRAPKQSKGSLVATSNFVNSTAGLLAVASFLVLTSVLESMMALGKQVREAIGGDHSELVSNLERQMHIPRLLFLAAAVMTVLMIVVLRRQLPDFFLRSLVWLRNYGKARLYLHHVQHLPAAGPVIVFTDAPALMPALHVASITDRTTMTIAIEPGSAARGGDHALRFLLRRAGSSVVDPDVAPAETWPRLARQAAGMLAAGHIVIIAARPGVAMAEIDQFVDEARRGTTAAILPVHYEVHGTPGHGPAPVHMALAPMLPTEAKPAEARAILAAPAEVAA